MGLKPAFLLSLVVAFAALVVQASALELNYYGIDADISTSMAIDFEVTMITDGPVNSLDYNLDFRVLNLTVETSSGTSRCSADNTLTGGKISCDFYGMDEGSENTVKMRFMTRDGVKRAGDQYEFRAAFPVTMPIKKMFSTVKLPPKSTLAMDVANESYFPPSGRVITDGRRIIVSWQREALSQNDTLSFSVLFEVIGSGGTMWDLTIIVMVSIVIVAMVGIAVYMRRSSPAQKGEVKVLPLLNKDEKRIVDIVAKGGGARPARGR